MPIWLIASVVFFGADAAAQSNVSGRAVDQLLQILLNATPILAMAAVLRVLQVTKPKAFWLSCAATLTHL